MYARVVEMNIVPDKFETFRTLLNSEILPILKKTPGFVDSIGMVTERTPTRVVAVNLFKTKSDLERYERETLPGIFQKLKPFLTVDPKVEICTVETSTFHRITAGMAA